MPKRNRDELSAGSKDRVAAALSAGSVAEEFVPFVTEIKGQPYMSVDGRAAMAASRQSTGRNVGTMTWVNASDEPETIEHPEAGTLLVPAGHAVALAIERDNTGIVLRMSTGTERVRKGGKGADSTHWIANAETSAIGRALGSLGFGLIPGSGLTTSEVMSSLDDEEDEEQPKKSKSKSKAKKERSEERSDQEEADRKRVLSALRERVREANALGSNIVNRHSIRNHVAKTEECGEYETLAELYEHGSYDELMATGMYVAMKMKEATEEADEAEEKAA